MRRLWKSLSVAAGMVAVAASLAAQSDSSPTVSRTEPSLPVEVLHTPGTLAQGDPLSAYVTSAAPLAELELAVELADGERVAGSGFAVRRGPAGTTWAAVLGIPSNAPAGEARLTISGLLAGSASRAETRVMLHEQPLVIGEREFAVEEIPLNTGLSNLRRTTDPQRKTESWELWLLLSASRPVAWPHYGPLRLPLGDVRRTGGFGDRRLYRYADGNTATTIHNGVDFGVPTGTVVAAAGGGAVAMARERIVTGFTVVIEHLPGVYSLYYHLDGLAVREGQRVFAGEPIGTVGSTGLATGPHLHWEVRAAGVAVDPDLLVAAPLVDLPDD
ncbi:MAG: M23 family metallopeptidase [Spirochaetaceae bacterium]|nr:M23 family metallopeptidase [Spirochaetaceae bacterium]